MKCCCVIGGTGFIGSFVVKALLAEGRKVIVIGRNEMPTRPLSPTVEYFPGDFGDKYFLRGVLSNVDEIIDLAYASVPKTSYDNPVQDIFDNLPPVVSLLEVASQANISKIVMVSSGGVIYGHTDTLSIDETHPTNPISPYGITKLAVENYARMFHTTRDLPVVCVRPSNAYGETQKPFVGQGFIATAIASILAEQEITLFGQSGTIRDYIHVSDIASGIVAALESGSPGEVYNIGTGVGMSNRDILDAIQPLAVADGFNVKIHTLSRRKFDVRSNILDSSRLRKSSGWSDRIIFSEGIKRTWDWFKKTGSYRNQGRIEL